MQAIFLNLFYFKPPVFYKADILDLYIYSRTSEASEVLDLLQVSKNVDEKCCFLKKFGFKEIWKSQPAFEAETSKLTF